MEKLIENANYASGIVVAAGSSSRMEGIDKLTLDLCGKPLIIHTLCAFLKAERIKEIVLVVNPVRTEEIQRLLVEFLKDSDIDGKAVKIVKGGETRQASVQNGVQAISENADIIAVHDGARPFITPAEIDKLCDLASEKKAVAAAVPVKDTIKVALGVDGLGVVEETPDRSLLWQVQTPQVFERKLYIKALDEALSQGIEYTDDCQLVERHGGEQKVFLFKTSYNNIKITTREDICMAESIFSKEDKNNMGFRIGHGYDVHRLKEGRRLIIGGVEIPHETGLDGHSDADVLAHAVSDALLGGAGMGDIGKWFPDTDGRYKDADSIKLLEEVVKLLEERFMFVENIDATVVAQRPKLRDYIDDMRKNIALACNVDISAVNVKATTEENLGFTGEEKGISSHAICLLSVRKF